MRRWTWIAIPRQSRGLNNFVMAFLHCSAPGLCRGILHRLRYCGRFFRHTEEQSLQVFFVRFEFADHGVRLPRQLEKLRRRKTVGNVDHYFVLTWFLTVGECYARAGQRRAKRLVGAAPGELVAV